MAENNNNNQDRKGEGRDPGQDIGPSGQDIEPSDEICSIKIKEIMDRINKRYGKVLGKLARDD